MRARPLFVSVLTYPHTSVADSDALSIAEFTGFPSGEARNICATFVRDCEALKGDPANEKTERSCHRVS